MPFRVDPISPTAPTNANGAQVLKYVPPPRKGIKLKFSDQKWAVDGWGAPFEDVDGEPINLGWGTVNSTTNNWSEMAYRNATKSWDLKRNRTAQAGNCNWRSADGTKVISWMGEDGNTLESPTKSTPFTARVEPNVYSPGARFLSPNEGGNPGLNEPEVVGPNFIPSSTWAANPAPLANVSPYPVLYTGNTGVLGVTASDGNDADGCLFSMVNNGLDYKKYLENEVSESVTYPFVEKRSSALWMNGSIVAYASDPSLPVLERFIITGAAIQTDTSDRDWIVAFLNIPGTNIEFLGYRGVVLEPEEGTELWDGWFLFETMRPARISVFNHHGWRFNDTGTEARCLFSIPMHPLTYWTQDVTLWTSYRTGRTGVLEARAVMNVSTDTSSISIIDTQTIDGKFPFWDLDEDNDDQTNPIVPVVAATTSGSVEIENTTVDVPHRTNVLCPDIPWQISSYVPAWPSIQAPGAPYETLSDTTPIQTKVCVDYEGQSPVYLIGELSFNRHYANVFNNYEGLDSGATPGSYDSVVDCIRSTPDDEMANPARYSMSGGHSMKHEDRHRYLIQGGTRDGQVLFDSGTNVRIKDVEWTPNGMFGEGTDDFCLGFEENSKVCIPLAIDLRYGVFVYQYAEVKAHLYRQTGLDMSQCKSQVKYWHPVHGDKVMYDMTVIDRVSQDNGTGNVSYTASSLEARHGKPIEPAYASLYSTVPNNTLGFYIQPNRQASDAPPADRDTFLSSIGYCDASVNDQWWDFRVSWDWFSYNFAPATSGVNPGMSNPQIPNSACGTTFFHVRSDIIDKQPMCFCVDPDTEDNEFIFSAPLHIMPQIAWGHGEFYVPNSTLLSGFYRNDDWEETTRLFYGSEGNNLDTIARPYSTIADTFRVEAIGLV